MRYLIVNADDLGASRGINRGIVEAYRRGIVTSASLMVTGRALDGAAATSRENPKLAIGLHFDVSGGDEGGVETSNVRAIRDEFFRQIDKFVKALGRMPTHIDSHHHVHLHDEHLVSRFKRWVEPFGVPLRGHGEVNFVGGFYAQWEWKVTELKYVSVKFLRKMLRTEVPPGFTEFSCHPGYGSDDCRSVYLAEREAELATLTDPRIRQTIEEQRIHLISYADYAQIRGHERAYEREVIRSRRLRSP